MAVPTDNMFWEHLEVIHRTSAITEETLEIAVAALCNLPSKGSYIFVMVTSFGASFTNCTVWPGIKQRPVNNCWFHGNHCGNFT